MLNEQNPLSDSELRRRRFIEDLGSFFAGYGLGSTVGRIYAYLLLRLEPASLDTIATDLAVAKSGVSTQARMLETWGMVRRVTEQGSRRVLVEAQPRGDALLSFGLPQVHRFAATLRRGVEVAEPGLPAARIEDLARVMDLYLAAVSAALEHIREDARR